MSDLIKQNSSSKIIIIATNFNYLK